VLRHAAVLASVITIAGFSQEKPAISFDAILACVKAGNCRNMTPGRLNWFDQVNIPVIDFRDDSGAYGLAISRLDGALSIWITPPGETKPSRLLSVWPEDTVLSAELGPMPGDTSPTQRKTPEETAQSRLKHKAFLSPKLNRPFGSWGEEFRPFWEAQAAQALAAIRRQMSK